MTTFVDFMERVHKLAQDIQPGFWQPQFLFIPCRSVVVVPHYHGRTPDLIEKIDGQLLILLTQIGGFADNGSDRYTLHLDPGIADALLPGGMGDGGGEHSAITDCIPTGGLPAQGLMLSVFGGVQGGPGVVLPTTPIPTNAMRPEGCPLYETVGASPAAVVLRNWTTLPAFIILLTATRQGDMDQGTPPEPLYLVGVYFDFFYGPTSNPLEVAFFDVSSYTDTVAPASWLWDFGDAGTSTDPHPVHTYAAAGDYVVTMTVTFPDGSTRTVTKNITVV